jgi:hypothetical protein
MPRKEKQERGSYLTNQQKGGTTRADKAEANDANKAEAYVNSFAIKRSA